MIVSTLAVHVMIFNVKISIQIMKFISELLFDYSNPTIKLPLKYFKKEGNYILSQIPTMNSRYPEMLRTLKVCGQLQIPPYEEKFSESVGQDLKSLGAQIAALSKQQKAFQDQLNSISSEQVRNLPQNIKKRQLADFLFGKRAICIDHYYRMKRFLLIYHNTRLNKIEKHFWHFGGNLSNQVKPKLTEIEKDYFNDYKTLATDYMEAMDIQLTQDLDPPLDASVEVRFLKDCGQILSDEGEPIKLEKNSVLYVKKRLIEKFLRDGSATVICDHSN